jgi:hypothetical protein
MTTLQEAISPMGTDQLQSVKVAALQLRDSDAARQAKLGPLWNAVLCAALDEQSGRQLADGDLFDNLAPNPVRVVGVIRP